VRNTVLKHARLTRDKLWPHGLRHQFVDDCVDAGIDALIILRLIGDADIGLIEKYYWRFLPRQGGQAGVMEGLRRRLLAGTEFNRG